MSISIGVVVPMTTTDPEALVSPWPAIEKFAQAAAESDVNSLWFADHLLLDTGLLEMHKRAHSGPNSSEDETPKEAPKGIPMGFIDPFSIASALAERFKHMTVGTLVASTRFRHPVILAKAAATLHDMTGGRFILGLGSGDSNEESTRFGFPVEKPVGRFEESIRIIRSLLRDGTCTFDGEFFSVRDADMRPPAANGGPPILVGSMSSAPRMNRIVSQYADIWNAHLTLGDNYPEAFSQIERYVLDACEQTGRDPDTLQRSVNVRVLMPGHELTAGAFGAQPGQKPVSGTPEDIADVILAYERAGLTHLQASLAPRTPDAVRAFGEVIRLVRSRSEVPA